ncbi:hypothetical protein GCM10010341_33060 [Streptomyces noursei]|nr:hypothetical protein GCM10010341_33060 [Streptomyces noursei]
MQPAAPTTKSHCLPTEYAAGIEVRAVARDPMAHAIEFPQPRGPRPLVLQDGSDNGGAVLGRHRESRKHGGVERTLAIDRPPKQLSASRSIQRDRPADEEPCVPAPTWWGMARPAL